MKIFWSWQSDTPGKTGRHFVRAALLEAIDRLKLPQDIEEPAEREARAALHLDQDRQGVSGSPDLAHTIFKKINLSAVFVADVTPVSTIPRGGKAKNAEKRNMNPNVAIELGYALHALTDEKVLLILNTHYGDRQYLPFDLSHKAGPIMYSLAPRASPARIKSEKAALVGVLAQALRPYITPKSGTAPRATFKETPSTISEAAYFQVDEPLATFGEGGDTVEFGYHDGNACYLRLIPTSSLPKPIMKGALVGAVQGAGLYAMWPKPSGMFSSNRYGAIVVEPDSIRGGAPKASTQVFGNGELWGVARWLLKSESYGRFIPGGAFERTYIQTLPRYVDFMADRLKILPPYTLEMGVVGLRGMNLIITPTGADPLGPFHDNGVSKRVVLNNVLSSTLQQALLEFFEDVFSASGYPRPSGLFGFPPADGA